MATKKTKQAESCVNPDYIDADGFLVLKGELFWRWRALDAEYQHTLLAVKDAQQTFEAEFVKIPYLVKLKESVDALRSQAKNRIEERQRLIAEMGKTLGVDMAAVAIDDTSGRVFIDSNGSAQPVPAPRPAHTTKRKKSAK